MRGREGRIKEGREKKGSREGSSSLSPSNKERREGAKEGGRITGSLDLFIPPARATKVDKGWGGGGQGGRQGARERASEGGRDTGRDEERERGRKGEGREER